MAPKVDASIGGNLNADIRAFGELLGTQRLGTRASGVHFLRTAKRCVLIQFPFSSKRVYPGAFINPAPLCLASNCHAAYQVNWSLSVFGKTTLPSPEKSIEALESKSRKTIFESSTSFNPNQMLSSSTSVPSLKHRRQKSFAQSKAVGNIYQGKPTLSSFAATIASPASAMQSAKSWMPTLRNNLQSILWLILALKRCLKPCNIMILRSTSTQFAAAAMVNISIRCQS